MSEFSLLVKGNIVTHHGIMENGALGIKDGKVKALFDPDCLPGAQQIIDARGKYIVPGAVDVHVHSFTSPGEGFYHSTRGAAAGGVTTIVDMPFDRPSGITHVDTFEKKKQLLQENAVVDVALLATINKKGDLDQVKPLVKAGACGFKLSVFESDPDRFPRIPDGELLSILQFMVGKNITCGFHAENEEIITYLIEKLRSRGESDPSLHIDSRPTISETTAAIKLIEFAQRTGAQLHIHHVSVPEICHLVEKLDDKGLISIETCPHYLVFNREDMRKQGAFLKINPPIREENQRKKMWEMLAQGKIDMVASDHAPWSREHKQHKNIFDNASGAPGVEALVPVTYSHGVAEGLISLERFTEVLSVNPAKRYGLYPRKGNLFVGADADFFVLDPGKTTVIDAQKQQSVVGWTPYQGFKLQGRIETTVVRGSIIYNQGEIVGRPGVGMFVPGIHGERC